VDLVAKDIVVLPAALEQQILDLLRCGGMSAEDSALTARLIVQTNLWGIDSHGALRVPTYIRRLQAGAINAQAKPVTLRSGGAVEVLDGQDGIGFVVGHAAMVRAVDLAAKNGVGVVGAINSNHFGAAGLYARLAADRGMVGIAMTNVAPNVVAPGGARPVTGNNPLAIAVPTYGEVPFSVDISFSAVSGGKLLLASKKGERIPLDWATDASGRPTDDPDAGFAGFLLPMGGFKGLGLAYAIDILCGVMTGGLFGTDLKGTYSQPFQASKTSHMMIAIDAKSFMSEDDLRLRMAQFSQMVTSSPMRDPQDEMLLPGEPEHRSALRRARGIPLPAALHDDLINLADELGAPVTLPRS
jgi:L-2-hydroxycarboxylate dehydrogenase (NAD+)